MSASISAEQIQKMITGNSSEKYLGGYGEHSPMLDLVNRLSGQLNQQTAESNLYRGGAGYGGSFQSADQKAARAAGTTLNAKPYGGWGGYGSQNPTMTNGGTGGGTYVPPPTPPVVTPNPGEQPTNDPPGTGGPGGQVFMPDTGEIPTTRPAPPPQVFTPNPPTAPPAVTQGPVFSPVPGTPSTTTGGNPYEAFAGDGGAVPTTWGGNLKPGDPGWNPAWEGGGPGGGFGKPTGGPAMTTAPYTAPSSITGQPTAANNATAQAPGLQQYTDPNVQKIYEALVRDGMEPSAAMQTDSISNMIAQGASPELIYSNYKAVLQQLGPKAFSMSHGQAGALNGSVEDLSSGQWLRGAITNMTGQDPGAAPVKPVAMTPANKANIGLDGGAGGLNVTGNEGTGAPGAGGGGVGGTGGGPGGGPGGPGGGTGGNPWGPEGGSKYNKDTGTLFMAKKDWGPQPSPPKGAAFGDVWTLPDGTVQTVGRTGTYHTIAKNAAGQLIVKDRNQYSDLPIDEDTLPPMNFDPEYDNVKDPKTPNPNMPSQIGATQVIGYDTYGNPIYNDNGLFEQGANGTGKGDVTPDAWSTSPDWRPEEPTGGLYGAYTQMAGGQLTDYENAIGDKWKNLSENPATADDTDYKNLVAEYNKTPGKGIDEAYGAYNTMINSNGYSDAEKGAMEGSAVRGISTGFQRGADEIRRQGARTNNRAAAYSALGNAGAAYGADLGETNRQNQIKFADEAQRRKEAGAAGMTNVAGLSNTRAQFGIGAAGDYAKEMARRREAGIAGMGDFATYGRGLQSQGLAGLSDMLKQSNSDKNNTYAQIAALLGTNVGQSSGGSSNTSTIGWTAGV